ncbi:hypothetical protein [Aeromicrobium sp. 179-A 4D2 NHS]|uniref:hypothetical protein n=1 Tax=Aeromicrobium sp. 179-A 4D2 NHS TaxID=3142375 RepID=UPI0039A0A3BE
MTARDLTPTNVARHKVSAERWEFTFESTPDDTMTPAMATVSLVVLDNQFGNSQDVIIEAVSERPRPKQFNFPSPEAFLRHIVNADLSPIKGTAEGTWHTDHLLTLLETGQFADDGIPRWVWRVLMNDTSSRAALRDIAYNLYGEYLQTDLWDDTLPAAGHLRAV